MRTVPRDRRSQRGVALIFLMTIVVLATSWMMVSAVKNASSRSAPALQAQNAQVLAQAKAALLAFVITSAATSNTGSPYYKNPGRFPCPEDPANAGSATNAGTSASNCDTLPYIGRLPWKTLGIEQPRDAAGEPLWYVLSAGFNGDSATLKINSNSSGQLALNGVSNHAVALIIAPGAAISLTPNSAQQAAGCTARTQRRDATFASTPDYRDYLECQNASNPVDASFVSEVTGNTANSVFNDQLISITSAELMPALEAVVAKRIETDIAPVLQGIYTASGWGTASNPLFPYAAPFADPSAADYKGTAGTTQGLLPLVRSTGCSGAACDATFVSWKTSPAPTVSRNSGASLYTTSTSTRAPVDPSCSATTTNVTCVFYTASGSMNVEVRATAQNVAMALRTLDSDGAFTGLTGTGATGSFNTDGSALISLDGDAGSGTAATCTFLGFFNVSCRRRAVTVPITSVLADHYVLNSSDAGVGWFTANDWHTLTYYAYSPNFSASVTTRSCTDSGTPTCMQVANLTPANKQRALLVLAGRPLSGAAAGASCASSAQTRPAGSANSYLECDTASGISNFDGDLSFAKGRYSSAFNDRIVVVSQNP